MEGESEPVKIVYFKMKSTMTYPGLNFLKNIQGHTFMDSNMKIGGYQAGNFT